ncbi:hypothetical protein ACIBTZ_29995 [Micromonospora sp. NPDC049460]|uniref:hypothetical protein n=1 Tax=Micromonospora sp. NPDC049460 TaxID=3364272 RepID=UPI0037BB568A
MNVPEILGAAAELATADLRTDAGLTLDDIRRDLDLGEWELALGMLEDVSDEHPQPARFWQLLADAAGLLQLDRSVAWCHWRSYESTHGVIRADLALSSPEAGGRRTAIPGAGVLRPMWDIGHRTSAGTPDLAIARIWVEFAPALEPGQQGTVRLAPLTPPRWRHLTPGDVITMHEIAEPIGIAEVIGVLPPAASG